MTAKTIGLCAILYVLSMGLSELTGLSAYAKTEQGMKPDTPDQIRGKKIFTKYCSGCHGSLGQGDGYRMLGPSPADFASLASRQKSDTELLKTIHEGKPNMPAWKFRLSQKDSQDVLGYIRTRADQ